MAAPVRDVRICFFGDSFTNGTHDETYLGWPARVCSALPWQVTHYNLGIRGNTALDIERRWSTEASSRWKPGTESRLFFSFGTNDASLENGAPRVSQNESVAAARRLLSAAQRVCPVLFSGPPAAVLEGPVTSFPRLSSLSQAYAALASELQIPYLDLFTPTRDDEAWQAAVQRGDGVHPGSAGYVRLANLVSAWSAWRAWW